MAYPQKSESAIAGLEELHVFDAPGEGRLSDSGGIPLERNDFVQMMAKSFRALSLEINELADVWDGTTSPSEGRLSETISALDAAILHGYSVTGTYQDAARSIFQVIDALIETIVKLRDQWVSLPSDPEDLLTNHADRHEYLGDDEVRFDEIRITMIAQAEEFTVP